MASKISFLLTALLLFVSFCNAVEEADNNYPPPVPPIGESNPPGKDYPPASGEAPPGGEEPVPLGGEEPAPPGEDDSAPLNEGTEDPNITTDNTTTDDTTTDNTTTDDTTTDDTTTDDTTTDDTTTDDTATDDTTTETDYTDTTTEETTTETSTEDPATPEYDAAPTITIEELGDIEGIVRHNRLNQPLFAYLKIAFAEPPINERRFKDPEPKQGLNNRTDPSEDMPICAQSEGTKTIGVEDCLYLNIYTPPFDPENIEPKAVMVFFHGGTFDEGSGKADFYDPRFLLTENIILVTVNYRLGILGFFNMENADLKTPGNAALKDQQLALTWIKNNIQWFGGDAENICLFGQGAGAASVHLHMFSPKSNDLFHKVILQSGTAISPWVMGIGNNGEKLAVALDVSTEDQEQMVNELRDKSVEQILAGARSVVEDQRYANNPWTPFAAPIVENDESEASFLTGNPFDLLEKGHYHHVPLLIGFNDAEGIGVTQMLRAAGNWQANPEDLFEIIPRELNVERGTSAFDTIIGRIQKLYFPNEDANGFIPLFTDVFFAFPALRAALEHSQRGNEPIYFYRFTADTKLNIFKLQDTTDPPEDGASHGDDLAYLFYIPDLTPELGQVEEEAMKRMVQTWTTFAKTGQPIKNEAEVVTSDQDQWTPFSKEDQNYADIGTYSTEPAVNVTTESLELWIEIYDEFFRNAASPVQVISLLATFGLVLAHILFNYS